MTEEPKPFRWTLDRVELREDTTTPSALTKQEKRERIARHLGWTVDPHGWWSHPTLPDGGGAMTDAPDYFHDLNACAQMEQCFIGNLERLHNDAALYAQWFDYKTLLNNNIHAKANERAEAFGLALNLWEA